MDWKSNNLVGIGMAALVSIGSIYGTLKMIPFAYQADLDREIAGLHAEITGLQGMQKSQWQTIQDERDKNVTAHERMNNAFQDADRLQKADIARLVDKYEGLLADERELRGEVAHERK